MTSGEAWMESVVNDAGLAFGEPGAFDEQRSSGLGIARDVAGLTQAVQNSPRHRAKRDTARFALRLEDAAECIDVVTGDQRPRRRQLVHELSVAVIDDVKEIEA